MKKMIRMIENIFENIKFRRKLREMDNWWYFMGGNCFGLFPPSFYYTHTEKEIKQITEEKLANLRTMIKERSAGKKY